MAITAQKLPESIWRRAAKQTLPTSTGTARLDTETRHDRETPAGDSRGARPDRGSGAAARARTHLRARLRRAQLWVPDDFVVLCRTQEEAEAVLAFLRDWTTAAGLTLHPTKTRIVSAESEGFARSGRERKACRNCRTSCDRSLGAPTETASAPLLPDAGNPPVRFGGRGGANHATPTSIRGSRSNGPSRAIAARATGTARAKR